MSLSKTAPMAFSMAHLSSLFIAPGRGNFLRFLAVLILMERGARPKAETSSLPSAGRPSQAARSQLFLWPLAARSTLWYFSRTGLKNFSISLILSTVILEVVFFGKLVENYYEFDLGGS